jgi:malate/lactate dehydrogenase
MAKVGIIGTGKIGSHLAEFLLASKSIEEIHLANRNKDRLDGRLISLQLRGHLLGSQTKVEKLDWKKINGLDLIAICIKDNYDPRKLLQQNELPDWLPHNLRYVGLLKDLPLIELLCSNRLKKYKGIIAVITNPVEITSFFISKWLPNSKVLGLGASVDSARISYIIKNELGFEIDKNYCVVAGEHGNDLIAVSKLWKTEKKLTTLSKKQIADYVNKATNVGFEIVNKLGFTLQDCVPVFAEEIKWILGRENQKQFHSLAIPTDTSCFSRPIKFNDKYEIIEYKNYTQEEEKHLKKTGDIIARFAKTLDSNFDL